MEQLLTHYTHKYIILDGLGLGSARNRTLQSPRKGTAPFNVLLLGLTCTLMIIVVSLNKLVKTQMKMVREND